MSPLEALRRYLGSHPEMTDGGSKSGFARLVGRSESLIRNIEAGRVRMSPKLSAHLSHVIGVCPKWLRREEVAEDEEIPAVDGSPLTIEKVESAMGRTLRNNLEEAAAGSDENPGTTSGEEQLAEAVARMVRESILQSLREQGDLSLLKQVVGLIEEWRKRPLSDPPDNSVDTPQ